MTAWDVPRLGSPYLRGFKSITWLANQRTAELMIGLVTMMAVLVLGLLIASARCTDPTQNANVQ